MDFILRGYYVNPATWFYLSLLLIIAIFFRFNRFWSLRNFDLALLLSTSPGLLLIKVEGDGEDIQTIRILGYGWLFTVSAVILIRLLLDGLLTRRPQFTQNLNGAGLAFLCVSAFVFLTAQAVTKAPASLDQATLETSKALVNGTTIAERDDAAGSVGPASPALAAPVDALSRLFAGPFGMEPEQLAVRLLAIVAHLAVVLGLLMVGQKLFGDPSAGWAMATLYLLLPCTAYDVGEFNHVLPAALIVWAVVAYRKPAVSGVLLGLACGSMFFPIFLLPLWAIFFGRRGFVRFSTAVVSVLALSLGTFAFVTPNSDSFIRRAIGTLDITQLAFRAGEGAAVFWSEDAFLSIYRIPIIVAYFLMLFSLTMWPRMKTVEHLLSHSAAIVVGTQFWFTQQGGIYLLWYLPLLLMVVFRPRLAHLRPPALDESAQSTAARTLGDSQPGARAGGVIERMHLFR